MPLNLPLVVHAVLDEYALPWDGAHGVAHWARVLENGLRLAKVTGANIEVVQLFAVFHDAKRVKETSDPDHGRFGAEFAAELRGQVFDLPDHEFGLLYRACSGHTHERTYPDFLQGLCIPLGLWVTNGGIAGEISDNGPQQVRDYLDLFATSRPHYNRRQLTTRLSWP